MLVCTVHVWPDHVHLNIKMCFAIYVWYVISHQCSDSFANALYAASSSSMTERRCSCFIGFLLYSGHTVCVYLGWGIPHLLLSLRCLLFLFPLHKGTISSFGKELFLGPYSNPGFVNENLFTVQTSQPHEGLRFVILGCVIITDWTCNRQKNCICWSCLYEQPGNTETWERHHMCSLLVAPWKASGSACYHCPHPCK